VGGHGSHGNGLKGVWGLGANWRVYTRMSDFVNPGPSMTFVFLDQREDAMNNGYFAVEMDTYPDMATTVIANYPGSYHGRAGGLSFADGHSEMKRWTDPRTTPELKRGGSLPSRVSSPNNLDVYWMQERTTRLVQ
jgi:hypothetical protein